MLSTGIDCANITIKIYSPKVGNISNIPLFTLLNLGIINSKILLLDSGLKVTFVSKYSAVSSVVKLE